LCVSLFVIVSSWNEFLFVFQLVIMSACPNVLLYCVSLFVPFLLVAFCNLFCQLCSFSFHYGLILFLLAPFDYCTSSLTFMILLTLWHHWSHPFNGNDYQLYLQHIFILSICTYSHYANIWNKQHIYEDC